MVNASIAKIWSSSEAKEEKRKDVFTGYAWKRRAKKAIKRLHVQVIIFLCL